jgi:hypothetical protein
MNTHQHKNNVRVDHLLFATSINIVSLQTLSALLDIVQLQTDQLPTTKHACVAKILLRDRPLNANPQNCSAMRSSIGATIIKLSVVQTLMDQI